MTNGSAPSADAPENESSTTPTAGPPNDKLTMPYPVTAANLTEVIQRAYQTGWEMARAIPDRQAPLPVEFQVQIDRDTRQVNITAVVS